MTESPATRIVRQMLRESVKELARPEAWIVVNIGCIECGVSSEIVGVFTDKERAEVLSTSLDKTHNWREGGQNAFAVFPMPELDVVAQEYLMEPT
jgi:hypothetical protein